MGTDDLHVVEAEAFDVSIPVSPPRGDSRGYYASRLLTMVRLTTGSGHVGWGAAGGRGAAALRVQVLPALMRAGAARWDRVAQEAALAVGWEAIGAVDLALWDAAARAAHKPLFELLGGRRRSAVLAVASVHNYAEGRDELVEAEAAVALARQRGFHAIKLKVGRGSLDHQLSWLRHARRSAGEGVELLVDANQILDRPAALALGEHLADLGVIWFEEPLARDDLEGYRWLRSRLRVPLAGGEDCQGVAAAAEWLAADAVDVPQVNIARLGGLSRLGAVRQAAGGARLALHCWNTPLLHLATLHALATWAPDPSPLDQWSASLETTILPSAPDALGTGLVLSVDGTYAPPAGPGLGVEVDADAVRAYAVG